MKSSLDIVYIISRLGQSLLKTIEVNRRHIRGIRQNKSENTEHTNGIALTRFAEELCEAEVRKYVFPVAVVKWEIVVDVAYLSTISATLGAITFVFGGDEEVGCYTGKLLEYRCVVGVNVLERFDGVDDVELVIREVRE
ncbi:hypothetical protein HFX_5155 (plasmid) [Haloferax mediterranei ATCC 33500]|uniref:Uncharacterized protein n=1 Tax=Haloferax mediterranei (strain ATCC 33500 / DSM 1411 / JCM 8866 / NBRC 14739 / NCIMB 2177 / R-4) TaxID=523841 RepID=I3R9T0_HALMT|nr:hypothetical protein HFX_5155 [Haloferax mediterranei ATCC 33500]